MTTVQSIMVTALAIAAATFGYLYYQSQQNVIEIKLPSVKIDR